MSDRIWNVAEYARLSREDGDKAESNSITSQREMIRDFVLHMPDNNYNHIYPISGLSNNVQFPRIMHDYPE